MAKPSTARQIEAHKVKHPVAREVAKILFSMVVVVAGIGLALFLKSLAKAPPTKESTALLQQVRTYRTQSYAGSLFLEVSGSVVPHREIKVAAEVAGRIIKRYPACENGMFVSKGEPLLEIDPEAYQLELRTLEADVAQAKRRIEENQQQMNGEIRSIELAKSDLALQQQELDRNKRIANALSQSELEQSSRAYNAAQQQLTTRENNLNTLKSTAQRLEAALEFSNQQIEKAKWNLRRTTIKAPADGVIVKAMVQEGDYVPAGTLSVLFEDTSRAEVLVNLTPAELKWIRDNNASEGPADNSLNNSVYRIPPTDVTILDTEHPDVTWNGVLNRFDGIGRDDVTKTIPCRIHVAQPIVDSSLGPHVLVRGMFVKCRMVVHVSGKETRLFSIPEVALHPDNSLWVVTPEKALKQAKVEVVHRTQLEVDGKPETFLVVKLESGQLNVGDSVVMTPLSQPYSGMPVLLETEGTGAAANESPSATRSQAGQASASPTEPSKQTED